MILLPNQSKTDCDIVPEIREKAVTSYETGNLNVAAQSPVSQVEPRRSNRTRRPPEVLDL